MNGPESPAPRSTVRPSVAAYTAPDALEVGAHLGLVDEDALSAYRRKYSSSRGEANGGSWGSGTPALSNPWMEAWSSDADFSEGAINAVESPLAALLKGEAESAQVMN